MRRRMGAIALVIVAGCQPPAIFSVSFEMFRIRNAVLPVYQSLIQVLLPIVGVFVFQSPRVDTDKGVVRKEQRAAVILTKREPYPVIGAAVEKVFTLQPTT